MASNGEYELTVRQQPKQARMCSSDKVDRRPIDPPPIVQLVGVASPSCSPSKTQYLHNPYYFMFASLSTNTGETIQYLRDGKTLVMTGAAVSNMWHLQDSQNNNQEAGFFVFPDLSIRSEGNYRLKFTLFEVKGAYVRHCKSILSDTFCVFIPTRFPGMQISTPLSCSLADQGIKIRLRHDTRIGNKPAKRAAEQEAREMARKRGRMSMHGDGGGRRSTCFKANGSIGDDNAHGTTGSRLPDEWNAIDPSLTETADASLAHAPPEYPEYTPRRHMYSPPVAVAYDASYHPPIPTPSQSSAPYLYEHHPQHPPGDWHAPPPVQHAHPFPSPPPDWYGYEQEQEHQQAAAESDCQEGTKELVAPHSTLRARTPTPLGMTRPSPHG